MRTASSVDLTECHFREVCGDTLYHVIFPDDGWEHLPATVEVPTDEHLFSFRIYTQGRSFLVLDPYGDEEMPDDAHRRLLGGPRCSHPLVIDRDTGEVWQASFGTWVDRGSDGSFHSGLERERSVSLREMPDDVRLPKELLPRLHELESSKRPFRWNVHPGTLWDFLEHEVGWTDLEKNLLLELDLRPYGVQVWAGSWREVGQWRGA